MSEWVSEREREGEGGRENSKPLIVKDSSVRSMWTYLTASPCYRGSKREMRLDDTGF